MGTQSHRLLGLGVAASVAIGAIAMTGSAHANLLNNGSFEQGTLVNNGQATQSLPVGSTAMPGWTVVGDTISWIDAGNPFSVSASNGSRFLDLTDYIPGAPFGGVEQTVATTAGYQYLLSFDLGSSNLYGRPSAITASAAGASQTFTGAATGTNSDWQTFSLSFTATGATTTITLVGQAGINYIGLDNVDLVLTAVPEPSSAALLMLGLAGVGVLVMRRVKDS